MRAVASAAERSTLDPLHVLGLRRRRCPNRRSNTPLRGGGADRPAPLNPRTNRTFVLARPTGVRRAIQPTRSRSRVAMSGWPRPGGWHEGSGTCAGGSRKGRPHDRSRFWRRSSPPADRCEARPTSLASGPARSSATSPTCDCDPASAPSSSSTSGDRPDGWSFRAWSRFSWTLDPSEGRA
jgi:hypothetical protein